MLVNYARHIRAAFGRVVPGKATTHERARCGTNNSVVGIARKSGSVGGQMPSAMESRVVQVVMVVFPEPSSVMWKLDVGGITRQAVAVETVPRSIFHMPPGVRSLLCGKARTRTAAHGPGVHVVFLTKTDTLRNGATGDKYMAKAGSSSAVHRMRREKYPRRSLGLRMNPRSGNRAS
jgi:hypothetical protein